MGWQDILLLLEQGQYNSVEEVIQQLQNDKLPTKTIELQIVLSVALQICEALAQIQSEEEFHHNSYWDAQKREYKLLQLLKKIIRQIIEWDLFTIDKVPPDSQNKTKKCPTATVPQTHKQLFHQYFQKLLRSKPVLVTETSSEPSINTLSSPNDEPLLLSSFEELKSTLSSPYSLIIFCLGKFQVYLGGHLIIDWPRSKGKSIFKYLVTHKEQPVAKEVLMELFWPNASPESARRNLNWAIHTLRQALHKSQPDFSHVLFQNECYQLNPILKVWIDTSEFTEHIKKAQMLDAGLDVDLMLHEYQAAELLYNGEFLEEDRYEEWVFPIRQSFLNEYIHLLDCLSSIYHRQEKFDECVNACNKILAIDPCREEVYQRLMQCYYQTGYPYLAIRQYHLCVEKLKTELDVSPSQQTTALLNEIRYGKVK